MFRWYFFKKRAEAQHSCKVYPVSKIIATRFPHAASWERYRFCILSFPPSLLPCHVLASPMLSAGQGWLRPSLLTVMDLSGQKGALQVTVTVKAGSPAAVTQHRAQVGLGCPPVPV